jgi:hypothetical protein
MNLYAYTREAVPVEFQARLLNWFWRAMGPSKRITASIVDDPPAVVARGRMKTSSYYRLDRCNGLLRYKGDAHAST